MQRKYFEFLQRFREILSLARRLVPGPGGAPGPGRAQWRVPAIESEYRSTVIRARGTGPHR
eukprot:756726-Hanusia_phi.AAC.5